MDGKEAILKRILTDGENKAKAIVIEAQTIAEKQKSEAENWASNYLDVQTKLAKDEAEELIRRRLTVADLDVRKEILKAKQEVISRVLDKVYNDLCSLGKAEYLDLIENLIEKFADSDDIVMLSNDGIINEEDVKSLKVFIAKNLSVCEKIGEFKGGVRLNGKVSDKDLTFKAVINEKKEKFVSQIAEDLFS